MADLEIKFKTAHEGEGGQQAQKEIDRVKESASQAAPAMGKAADATDQLAKKKQLLKDAARGVALELPIVGRVLSFLTNPLTLATAAISVAAGKFLDWKRSVEEAGRKQAELETLRRSLASFAMIMNSISGERMTAAIDAIGDAAKAAVADLDRLNAKIDQTTQRADELEDLELGQKKAAIRAAVAGGSMSEGTGRAALAELENKSDETKAQREFRALQAKKKNQEDALRELDPQLSRLQSTPDEDVARLKQRALHQKAVADRAATDFQTEGAKALAEKGDAEASLSAFRQGKGVDVREWGKFGIAKPGMSRDEVEGKIVDFIEGKQREFDSLGKSQDFERAKSQKLDQQVSDAERQNQQRQTIETTRDQLRKGIKDTDEEIAGRTQFNRRALQLKRGTRAFEVEEFNANDQRKEDEKRERELERGSKKGFRGTAIGDGEGTGRIADAATRAGGQVSSMGREAADAIKSLEGTMVKALAEIRDQAKQADSRAKHMRSV